MQAGDSSSSKPWDLDLNRPDPHFPALKVVIAYQDTQAGKRAIQVFAHISSDHHLHHSQTQFDVRPWRFDFLADPLFFQSALAEAVEADIIVIAASQSSALPPAVKDWVTACFRARLGRRGAIIPFLPVGEEKNQNLDSDADPADASALQFLRDEAAKSGLTFLEPSTELATKTTPTSSQSYLAATPWYHLSPRSNTVSFDRQWGINE